MSVKRRKFIQQATLALGGLSSNAQTTDTTLQTGVVGTGRIYFEVHGQSQGRPLFLGFPFMASYAEIFGGRMASIKTEYLKGLTDRYRVLLVDYPTIGQSGVTPATELTADRVCADLLAVADNAGFRRFSYCGFLWGAVNGLLLASRSRRVSALVCGSWPPLGAPYAEMLAGTRESAPNPPPRAMPVLRDKAQYAQWVTYYESLQGWPEAKAIARIKCPRLALYGSKAASVAGSIQLPLAETIRAHHGELEKLGWEISELKDKDAGVMLEPAVVLPVLRAFLDQSKN